MSELPDDAKPIPGYPGYYARPSGEIWSTKRRTMRLKPSEYRYAQVGLAHKDGQSSLLVHRLILRTFDRPPEPGEECRHLNGDGLDNRLENLAWGTRAENQADRVRHGTDCRGEKTPLCRTH